MAKTLTLAACFSVKKHGQELKISQFLSYFMLSQDYYQQ